MAKFWKKGEQAQQSKVVATPASSSSSELQTVKPVRKPACWGASKASGEPEVVCATSTDKIKVTLGTRQSHCISKRLQLTTSVLALQAVPGHLHLIQQRGQRTPGTHLPRTRLRLLQAPMLCNRYIHTSYTRCWYCQCICTEQRLAFCLRCLPCVTLMLLHHMQLPSKNAVSSSLHILSVKGTSQGR